MALDVAENSDQLVVDLLHLDVVEAMLKRWQITYNSITAYDRDERLGLARLRDLRDAAGQPLDVGELTALLRQRCAAERDGWTPTIGRNRDVYAVIGESHKPMSIGAVGAASHKPMAGGEPRPFPGDLPRVETTPTAGEGVRVGLVDTRAADPGTYPVPYRSGHALFVRGLIEAYAPKADVVEQPVLDPHDGHAGSWDTAQAIMTLAGEHRLDILNLSLGCFTIAGGPPLVIARAIERLGPDVLVIAAAGNHGEIVALTDGHDRGSATWPAGISSVAAIGAVDNLLGTPPWSPALPWVRYAAPGVDVVSTYLRAEKVDVNGRIRKFEGKAKWSGTSFAAAIASGSIAARTRPGSVTAREALAAMVEAGNGPVRERPR
ncbi:S8/S53 family peptidase [Dactylosporangium sp. NPDC051541]|uniref:S8/S53 family peptidase n=1 Tax=Dactylosporangium sp. NPDC051541 TaxID=3363977 RepID=UPI0037BA7A02